MWQKDWRWRDAPIEIEVVNVQLPNAAPDGENIFEPKRPSFGQKKVNP